MNADTLPPSWTTCSIAEAGAVTVGQQKSPEASAAKQQYPYLRIANWSGRSPAASTGRSAISNVSTVMQRLAAHIPSTANMHAFRHLSRC
jgi:hypothetical protein